ncbi:type II secretion system protein J [Chelativorans sp. J32]|uniref:PulJ/GspJ family protein n=1 Tax=Chelativorans sp. J32 TaxID=935840 RepID=UPI000488CD9A|nr:prepilin-type N-terminal cleavage/methylation domain-containing protein [Chelativorans sp. J32]
MTRKRSVRDGFTLIEALASLVLATMLFGGLSLYTGTWLRHWQGMIARGGQEDTVAVILDRMVEDLEAAQPGYSNSGGATEVRFTGHADKVTFVRPALGYERRAGLDDITYSMGRAGADAALIRARRDHMMGEGGEDLPLVRGDLKLSFSYAGPDGALNPEWTSTNRMPSLVRIEISGSSPRPWRQWAYARLRVELPARCGAAQALAPCLQRYGNGF